MSETWRQMSGVPSSIAGTPLSPATLGHRQMRGLAPGEGGTAMRLLQPRQMVQALGFTWRLRTQCTRKMKAPCRLLMMVNKYAITLPAAPTWKRPRLHVQPRMKSWAMALKVSSLDRGRWRDPIRTNLVRATEPRGSGITVPLCKC